MCTATNSFNAMTVGNYYLKNHADLLWVASNSTAHSSLPGDIKVTGGGLTSSFGRILSGGVYKFGKAIAGDGLKI
jgi:hypothetical protein